MNVVNEVLAWLTDPAQWSGPDGIPARTLQHLWYSLLATGIAAGIALPIGVYIGHTGRGALVAVNLTNLGRAIPSLGIIILMFTLVGFGLVPVLVALTALAVPPIVTNSYVGVRSVDRDVREAAEGMGMRGRQVLWQVELPVAMPLIMTGIRTSAVPRSRPAWRWCWPPAVAVGTTRCREAAPRTAGRPSPSARPTSPSSSSWPRCTPRCSRRPASRSTPG